LGRTGLMVSRLAFGTGTHGWAGRSQQTDLGFDELVRLLRLSYELGVNTWDSADQYGSHPHVAAAKKGVPRKDLVLITKTTSTSRRAVQKDVERFRREMDVDVLDVVLLHCISNGDWVRRYAGAMEALSEAKEKGVVRAVGISCHSLAALQAAVDEPWVDVVLARINYSGRRMDDIPARVVPVLEQLYKAGKGVYAMKVLGCGSLIHDPEKAMRYVLGLGTVATMSIGMSSERELRRNAELVMRLSPEYPLRSLD